MLFSMLIELFFLVSLNCGLPLLKVEFALLQLDVEGSR